MTLNKWLRVDSHPRASVAQFLADQWRQSTAALPPSFTIFQHGQVRHLPFPLLWKRCWTSCPLPGTYQNGAFWATPLNWVLEALNANVRACLPLAPTRSALRLAPSLTRWLQGFHSEAAAVASAAVSSFMSAGVAECINTDIHYSGVVDYVASATNVFGSVHPAP